jgi:dolichol-phosphate mannosyltransferase|tara:strand:- start:246 stop:953 length:708 start_codon:yes stop_codon:yes gene_type:complete
MSVEKKILVFTATFNELDNIKNLVSSIKKQPSNPHILIIDDNSPDGTSEEIKKLQNNFKNLFLIKRNNKLGLDSAHKEAYEFALKNNYDLLITMDADLSHDPNELSNFIRNLEEFPVVLGSRYIDGGQCLMKGRRLIFSKYGNLIIKFIFQLDCNEFTTSYRGFNLKKLNNFHLNLIKTKGYSFFMGTVHEIFKQKFKVKEIPIIFNDRKKGYSKIPRVEILRTIINLLILRFIK